MGRCPFCQTTAAQSQTPTAAEWATATTGPASLAQRGKALAGWLVPVVTLASIPKCPMCFAAYAAMFTGIGVSVTAATYVRQIMIALCVLSLTYMIVASLGRRLRERLVRVEA
jgi:hypothetical protein